MKLKSRRHNQRHWQQAPDYVLDEKPLPRPLPLEGVVQSKHIREGHRRLFMRYKSVLLVLRGGYASVYAFKRQAKSNDRLIHRIDLGQVQLYQFDREHKVKIVTGDDSFQFKLATDNYNQWLQHLKRHRWFRQGEVANALIETSMMSQTMSSVPNAAATHSLATVTYNQLRAAIDESHVEMHALDKHVRHMNDGKEVLRQLADAMGNNHVKQQLMFNTEFVQEAKKLQVTFRGLLRKLDTIVKTMQIKVDQSTPTPSSDTPTETEVAETTDDEDSDDTDVDMDSKTVDEGDTTTEIESNTTSEGVTTKENNQLDKQKPPSIRKIVVSPHHRRSSTEKSVNRSLREATSLKRSLPSKSVSARERRPAKTSSVRQRSRTPQPRSRKEPVLTERRTKLPCVAPAAATGMAMLSNGGRLPITLYEPASMLQLMCGDLAYSRMLCRACKQDDHVERMALVCAFAISAYSDTAYRSRKPFNPLLGETFEQDRRADFGWRFIAEQVSHGPDISAAWAQGNAGWTWNAVANLPRTAVTFSMMRNNRMDVQPLPPSNNQVLLHAFDESYTWNKVTTSICSLTSASRWVSHAGNMNVKCSNGLTCAVKFEPSKSQPVHTISGTVMDGQTALCQMGGEWTGDVWRQMLLPRGQRDMVHSARPITDYNQTRQYGFSAFAVQMNEITTEIKDGADVIAPTDCRYRPDMRILENARTPAELDAATKHKDVLEQQQRDRVRNKQISPPLWFRPDACGKRDAKQPADWVYTNAYWEAKETKFNGVNFPKLWPMAK